MDSARILQCHSHMIRSGSRKKEKQLGGSSSSSSSFSIHHLCRHTPHPLLLLHRPKTVPHISAVSSTSTQTREERNNKKKKNKVRLRLRLNHQVEFGDHVVISGSAKELGSWKKPVPLDWTQEGWACYLDFQGSQQLEFKFIIVDKDNTLLWEAGDNRLLNLPEEGHFGMVATWNATRENMDLQPLELDFDGGEIQQEKDFSDAATNVNDAPLSQSEEPSPFVGQWQGKTVTFMQSNEHRTHETERKWDTTALQGLPLKLVQGDQNARNWWRKVLTVTLLLFIMLLLQTK